MTPAAARTARTVLVACMLGSLLLPAFAAGEKEPAKPAARKPTGKPATSREQLQDEAKGLALATETVEAISAGQLDAAARVLIGDADCEFNQKVTITAVDGVPGHFNLGFKNAVYRVIPLETTTGAIRLEDRKSGLVWLQIPTKSMLMNSKIGQRLVDGCTHSEQRAANAAAAAAGRSTTVGGTPAR